MNGYDMSLLVRFIGVREADVERSCVDVAGLPLELSSEQVV